MSRDEPTRLRDRSLAQLLAIPERLQNASQRLTPAELCRLYFATGLVGVAQRGAGGAGAASGRGARGRPGGRGSAEVGSAVQEGWRPGVSIGGRAWGHG